MQSPVSGYSLTVPLARGMPAEPVALFREPLLVISRITFAPAVGCAHCGLRRADGGTPRQGSRSCRPAS